MFKLKFFTSIFLLSALFPASAFSEILSSDSSIEASHAKVLIRNEHSGVVRAKSCDQCLVAELRLDQKSQVFMNGDLITMGWHLSRDYRGVMVSYNPETHIITEMYLFSRSGL